jgi:hypothetical protein
VAVAIRLIGLIRSEVGHVSNVAASGWQEGLVYPRPDVIGDFSIRFHTPQNPEPRTQMLGRDASHSSQLNCIVGPISWSGFRGVEKFLEHRTFLSKWAKKRT